MVFNWIDVFCSIEQNATVTLSLSSNIINTKQNMQTHLQSGLLSYKQCRPFSVVEVLCQLLQS